MQNSTEKTIYPSPLEVWSDDGDYLVMDRTYSSSVAFIEGQDCLRIPKDYLSICLRNRFTLEVEQKDDEDSVADFLDDLTQEITETFDAELEHFIKLYDNPIWSVFSDTYAETELTKSYIAYVLKAELYKQYLRINRIINAVKEPEGSKKYYQKLKDCVLNFEQGQQIIAEQDELDKAETDALVKRWNLGKAQTEEEKKDDAEQ